MLNGKGLPNAVDELVVFQESQTLPLFIVRFKDNPIFNSLKAKPSFGLAKELSQSILMTPGGAVSALSAMPPVPFVRGAKLSRPVCLEFEPCGGPVHCPKSGCLPKSPGGGSYRVHDDSEPLIHGQGTRDCQIPEPRRRGLAGAFKGGTSKMWLLCWDGRQAPEADPQGMRLGFSSSSFFLSIFACICRLSFCSCSC